ncbi:hypothetical protein H1R17_12790 [Flavobacterium sp. xlx-214]|uniref:hypothetical protein n=1 Tax=unclassified Flavobacterium TaxID=196869 RepID=UPI0013D2CDF8|nr:MULTISPECIES: hypothetical protein [unclassified Flavobacterium]MBA5791532.1 hypothetical protein [Flavobacterium sp. xlx-221]QMI83318.1 hypothetical protein H1R17_12790 [Flavobacterium sp. xlx-214]
MSNYDKLLKQIELTRSDELYVIDYKGCLNKFKCPFIVQATETVGSVEEGCKYEVLSVKISIRLETVYQINNSYYLYKSFEIL